MSEYQCRRGIQRDNCPHCEGTGMVIDFKAILARGGEDMNIQPKIAGATHTPGPWVVDVEGRMVEAQLPNLRNEYEHICDLRGGIKGQINVGNAHLIAAAPAMYEALAKLRLEAIHYRNTGVGVQFLNAAIDRAEVAINQAVGVTNDTARTS